MTMVLFSLALNGHTAEKVMMSALEDNIPSEADTVGQFVGMELSIIPGKVLSMDRYERQWLKENGTVSAEASLIYRPKDDGFAHDYNHPTFTAGIRFSWNHATKMHRDASPDWGQLVPVDYVSQLGNVVTVFGMFNRPLVNRRRWLVEYHLGMGVGYSHSKYNKVDGIDNELIGSRWLIYFSGGLSTTYFLTSEVGVKAGLNFSHHSNGGMNRPNKGTNALGPMLGIVVRRQDAFSKSEAYPSEGESRSSGSAEIYPSGIENCDSRHENRPSKWFAEVTVGVGGKTLAEEWQVTQFGTPSEAPDYRTDQFRFFMAYSLQADVMCRYARRWASGLGFDVFYGGYAGRVGDLNRAAGYTQNVSPWSLAVAAKHEVFYGNLSVRMGIGVYLYRRMGELVKPLEQPYYERIGVHYAFPRLGGFSVGFSVNAHRTKADFTELQLSMPFRL